MKNTFFLIFIFLIQINLSNLQYINLVKKFSNSVISTQDIDCGQIPPLFWCSNQKIIDLCGFNKPCSRYINASKNKPVHITIFYETLCPDCQDFILDDFLNVYNIFKDFLYVELVPYGNAQRVKISFYNFI